MMEEKLDFLYGRNVCDVALKYSRRPILRVLMNRTWEESQPEDERIKSIMKMVDERSIPISYKTSTFLSDMSKGRPHQGICLETGRLSPLLLNRIVLDELIKLNKQQIWVLLYDVYDPMNVGAILRSCSFLGLNTAFLTANCAPLSGTTCKASSGATEMMKLYGVKTPIQFVQHLQNNDWDIIGTDIEPSTTTAEDSSRYENVNSVKVKKPSLLILGSEGSGISDELKEKCDKMVTIKSAQTELSVSCLNVSAASAIILHQLLANSW